MELMTKKTLFAGVAAFALLMGTVNAEAGEGGEGGKIELKNNTVDNVEVKSGKIDQSSVSVNALQQVTANSAITDKVEDLIHHGMSFGSNTFQNQALNVNNIAQGINQAQQGGVSVAVRTGDIGP